MLRSYISGIGSYVPQKIVTNDDLAKFMETSDEWIIKRTGIKQRHWVCDGEEDTSDLALVAAKKAIEGADISKDNIDMIILATITPDHEFPGTACFLQAKLGLSDIPTLDIRQACSGFIYALSVGDLYVRSGQYKNILVVGCEIHSRGIDKSTKGRNVAVLFGDGAGAVVLSAREIETPTKGQKGYIFSTHLHTQGEFAKDLWISAPGTGLKQSERITKAMLDEDLHYPQMNGQKVFIHAVRRMAEAVTEALEKNSMSVNDVDLFLFHQANLRINEAVAKHMNIPAEKIFNTIERFGNTTAATIPLGMDYAVKNGVLKRGMTVCMAAFGSGFTWGSAILRY